MQAKIKRVSCFFRILFQVALIIVPLVHIVAWIYAPASLALFDAGTAFVMQAIPVGTKIMYPLSVSTKILGSLVSAIPVIIIEFIFYFLIKLFRLYEQGEIFSIHNVSYIKKTGYALLLVQLLRPITEAFVTAIATWHNPPGYRYAAVSFSGIDLSLLLTALLIILISWIMAEGCRLREEQQLTI